MDHDAIHHLQLGARGLVRRDRYRQFETVLPWQTALECIAAIHDPAQVEVTADAVALISYRIVMFLRRPPTGTDLAAVAAELAGLLDSAALNPAQRGLLGIRLGQVQGHLQQFEAAADTLCTAAEQLAQAEAPADRCVALMLQAQMLQQGSPQQANRLLTQVLRTLVFVPQTNLTAHLRYVALVRLADAAARRHALRATWYRRGAGHAKQTLHKMGVEPPDVTNPAYHIPYYEFVGRKSALRR